MKYLIFWAAFILFIYFLVKLSIKLASREKVEKQPTYPQATGCGSRESCIYLNLGKASKAGKPANFCWCEYYQNFQKRHDNCAAFKSRGCAEGMCTYADFQTPKAKGYSSKCCFCSYYNKIIEGKSSCPHYVDHFETPEGNELRRTFQNL